MKRILLLSDAGSEHTEKWALGLSDAGFEIGLFSIAAPAYNWFENNSRIHFLSEKITKQKRRTAFSKLGYLKLIPELKKAIQFFKPDILHAHYASSYGLLARLSKFEPYFISAWGTDVMKFPGKNFINRKILQKNLEQAAMVFATSNTTKEYILKVCTVPVSIIPFGVDLNQFSPKAKYLLFEEGTIVIAAIKVLDTLYCIDILIDAFGMLVKKYPTQKLQLLLVGDGPVKQKLVAQCQELEISNKVLFTGRVDFKDVSNYFNAADIFVNISEYESFGVSVIEASACELPVIVTDVGGLKEVVEQGVTGFRIGVRDRDATFAAIEKLMLDPELRKKMGKQGREKVKRQFEWKQNLQQMIEIYTAFPTK